MEEMTEYETGLADGRFEGFDMREALRAEVAELEGKVRELEERWAEVPWLLLQYAIQGELDDAEYEQMRAWYAAHAPKEPTP